MRVKVCLVLMAAACVVCVLPSCDSQSSVAVQNARLEEELRSIRSTISKPGASGDELKSLRTEIEEIRKAQSSVEKSMAIIKASLEARDSADSTLQQTIEKVQTRVTALETRLGRGAVGVGAGQGTTSGAGAGSAGRGTGVGPEGSDPNHRVYTVPWNEPKR